MRISDWSSDVCSSDLPMILSNVRKLGFDPRDIKFILSTEPHYDHAGGIAALARDTGATVVASRRGAEGLRAGAQDRKSVVEGKSVSVRVDLGGRRSIKKKTKVE